jgi:hypothetical protein
MFTDVEVPLVPFVFAVFALLVVIVCLLDGMAALDLRVETARPNEVFHEAPAHILELERVTRPRQ